ncbi:aminotransferase yhxA [Priestia taiwanensis]|uniref:Aminotransferase yhxA n=1 Tax=Priestia taiwanensis TaxID=1347902 RepID=A0A917ERA2_9BACI|nr:aminotransferase yhxA [Priestia taiwanensis]MBM7363846.1 hypothetical protein [Priestia taiwanensis]GGE69466.1 hypothetical protein GCM10007140_19400 [Priestia taiwanensis]
MKKTKKALIGVTTALAATLAGCEEDSANLPEKPSDAECSDWDFEEEEGVWVCDEKGSSRYRSYYYGGAYFGTKNALKADNNYKTYTQTPQFKSGFGSGSKSSGS